MDHPNLIVKNNAIRFARGNHSAVGDCLATLNLIKMLAEQEIISIPEGYKPEVSIQATDSLDQTQSCLVQFVIGALVFAFLLWLIPKC